MGREAGGRDHVVSLTWFESLGQVVGMRWHAYTKILFFILRAWKLELDWSYGDGWNCFTVDTGGLNEATTTPNIPKVAFA
jgi:hypothetical protein